MAQNTKATSLIEVRCKKVIRKVFKNNSQLLPCNALLTKIKYGEGETVCWRCGHMTQYLIQRG